MDFPQEFSSQKKEIKNRSFQKYTTFLGLEKFWFCQSFFLFCSWSKSFGFCPISSVFRQIRQSYHKISKIRQIRQFLGLKIATGDVSPAQISHRHRVAQNRGFGDISPEMLTLFVCLIDNERIQQMALERGPSAGDPSRWHCCLLLPACRRDNFQVGKFKTLNINKHAKLKRLKRKLY